MIKKKASKKTARISEIGELDLIRNLRSICSHVSPEVIVGIGDDTAVINVSSGKMLVTSDMMIDGVHFAMPLTGFYHLGHKILSVNISDIFAMGGTPRYFLLSFGIPGNYNIRDIKEMYSGLMRLSGKYGITVIGGDTCSSKHGLVLNGTLIGNTKKVITRSGAKIGDAIFVTNTLGDSAVGLEILKKMGKKMLEEIQKNKLLNNLRSRGKTNKKSFKINNKRFVSKDIYKLLRRHLMPEPRPLKNTAGVTSMIDISDGLLMDLSHICEESGVGAVIYKKRLPLSGAMAKAAGNLGKDPYSFALKGGEDYALLFTAPSNIRTKAFKIGEITGKGRFIVDVKGRKTPFKAEGYEHFK